VSISPYLRVSVQQGSANFTNIGVTIGQFKSGIDSLPSMTLLNSQLVSLNASIAALPDMYGLAARFAILNASLATWRNINELISGPIPAFYFGTIACPCITHPTYDFVSDDHDCSELTSEYNISSIGTIAT
jgi:hypothetical protein